MKYCLHCKIEKELNEFGIRNPGNKHRNVCKKCTRAKRKQIVRPPCALTHYTCRTCNIEKEMSQFHKNKNTVQGISHVCKDCRILTSKKRYKKYGEEIKKKTNSYYYNNKSKIRVYRRRKLKEKLSTDIFFKLKRRLRNRLYYALKRTEWKKNTHFAEYIGCGREALIHHLESQFQEGMTWENHGEWHIDHIIPLSSANTEQRLYELCHYKNLRPLWSKDNIFKGDKLTYEVKPIDSKLTYPYLLDIHYAKRIPSISFAFGLFLNGEMIGVVTYGKPFSAPLRKGIAGVKNIDKVFELNRLCLKHNLKNEASILVGRSLRLLPKNLIIISFADTEMNHVGYVYQATNFKYYGLTAKKTNWALKSKPELHGQTIADMARGQSNRIEYLKDTFGEDFHIKPRSFKHRYIFITGKNKSLFNEILYQEQPYPKAEIQEIAA